MPWTFRPDSKDKLIVKEILARNPHLRRNRSAALRFALDYWAGREISPREMAQKRIDSTPELKPHESTIMYEWKEGDEHWEWVVTASINEIVDWAIEIESYDDE